MALYGRKLYADVFAAPIDGIDQVYQGPGNMTFFPSNYLEASLKQEPIRILRG